MSAKLNVKFYIEAHKNQTYKYRMREAGLAINV